MIRLGFVFLYLSLTLAAIRAESRLEVDFWTGYNFPLNDSIRNQCTTYPATGNYCRVRGMSFSTGLFVSAIGPIRSGIGTAFLPISDGTLKVSDTSLVNIGSSYAPVMFQVRLDLGMFHFQLGTGYAIAIERPGVYAGQPMSSIDLGIYTASAEIGFRSAVSENVAFYTSFKHYALFPAIGRGVVYTVIPNFGIQANMAD